MKKLGNTERPHTVLGILVLLCVAAISLSRLNGWDEPDQNESSAGQSQPPSVIEREAASPHSIPVPASNPPLEVEKPDDEAFLKPQ